MISIFLHFLLLTSFVFGSEVKQDVDTSGPMTLKETLDLYGTIPPFRHFVMEAKLPTDQKELLLQSLRNYWQSKEQKHLVLIRNLLDKTTMPAKDLWRFFESIVNQSTLSEKLLGSTAQPIQSMIIAGEIEERLREDFKEEGFPPLFLWYYSSPTTMANLKVVRDVEASPSIKYTYHLLPGCMEGSDAVYVREDTVQKWNATHPLGPDVKSLWMDDIVPAIMPTSGSTTLHHSSGDAEGKETSPLGDEKVVKPLLKRELSSITEEHLKRHAFTENLIQVLKVFYGIVPLRQATELTEQKSPLNASFATLSNNDFKWTEVADAFDEYFAEDDDSRTSVAEIAKVVCEKVLPAVSLPFSLKTLLLPSFFGRALITDAKQVDDLLIDTVNVLAETKKVIEEKDGKESSITILPDVLLVFANKKQFLPQTFAGDSVHYDAISDDYVTLSQNEGVKVYFKKSFVDAWLQQHPERAIWEQPADVNVDFDSTKLDEKTSVQKKKNIVPVAVDDKNKEIGDAKKGLLAKRTPIKDAKIKPAPSLPKKNEQIDAKTVTKKVSDKPLAKQEKPKQSTKETTKTEEKKPNTKPNESSAVEQNETKTSVERNPIQEQTKTIVKQQTTSESEAKDSKHNVPESQPIDEKDKVKVRSIDDKDKVSDSQPPSKDKECDEQADKKSAIVEPTVEAKQAETDKTTAANTIAQKLETGAKKPNDSNWVYWILAFMFVVFLVLLVLFVLKTRSNSA